MDKVIIIMGSRNDLEWAEKIRETLTTLGIDAVMRVASAHKTPEKCLQVIRQFEQDGVVFITVAGRSNALSGFVDAQTACPVIACPPYSDRYGGTDIFSSLRMPSAVAPLVVLAPEGAAVAAAKILGLGNGSIHERVRAYQARAREKIEQDDDEVTGGKR